MAKVPKSPVTKVEKVSRRPRKPGASGRWKFPAWGPSATGVPNYSAPPGVRMTIHRISARGDTAEEVRREHLAAKAMFEAKRARATEAAATLAEYLT